MCGINGILCFEKKENMEEEIQNMNLLIKHRGPDAKGTSIEHKKEFSLGLGQVRLSIIGLNKKGNQPFKINIQGNEYIIVFNGEIYNYKELQEKYSLENESKTDTEIILRMYNLKGTDCVKEFEGMWAFVIYDKTKEKIFMSRDRFGKKPFYIEKEKKGIRFSSELKALILTKEKKEINKEALEEIFTYRFTEGTKTIIKGIEQFKPGHNLIYDIKKKKIELYKPHYQLKIREEKISFKKAKNKLRRILEESIKYRMVADVPVASFLSGGIDSTIITTIAKKYNKNLHTFSAKFETTDESKYARLVAKRLGTKHEEVLITGEKMLQNLDEMIYHMDEPIGADPGFLPIYILSKEVSKKFKVVLSGDGADEILLGYDRYKLFKYGQIIKYLIFWKSKNPLLRILHKMRWKNSSKAFIEITRVFQKEELGLKERKPRIKRLKNKLKKIQLFDIENLLSKDFFMKADKMSSAHGLEQRTPFISKKIVEFALSIPNKYKLKFLNEKAILKEAFKEEIPKEILKRKKHGFNVPIDHWFKNELKNKLLTTIKKNNHELYNQEYIHKLFKELETNNNNFKIRNIIAQKLWTILVFEMWYERFMR